jgi:hypothetical protein
VCGGVLGHCIYSTGKPESATKFLLYCWIAQCILFYFGGMLFFLACAYRAAAANQAFEEEEEERINPAGLELHSRKRLQISYSREDAELLVKLQDAVSKAGWQVTGVMSNQGKEWFQAWHGMLEKADGVCVLFTEGNAKRLNNVDIGYKDKAMQRFQEQGTNSALYREAMAILKIIDDVNRPDFKVYVIDGITHTTEQLAFNLIDGAPLFGPVEAWRAFIEDLQQVSEQKVTDEL